MVFMKGSWNFVLKPTVVGVGGVLKMGNNRTMNKSEQVEFSLKIWWPNIACIFKSKLLGVIMKSECVELFIG